MQQIRQQQVRGISGQSLQEDIQSLFQETMYFDAPVKKRIDLPTEGNQNGDIRVVLDENAIYTWDEDSGDWVTKYDTYTDNVTKEILLERDNQTTINTGIKVGGIGNMTTIDAVKLYVNGMLQKPVKDYIVTIDSNFNCMIEWKSRDFQLEISDTITMSYSIMFLS